MSHTYISDLVHCVFSTKDRCNLIRREIQPDLWAFLGVSRATTDSKLSSWVAPRTTCTSFCPCQATMPLAKAMQLIKGASSRWINETHCKGFAWQEGYGAFTVGISQKDHTIAYIQSQAEHHSKRSFEEEFIAFLKKHNVDYDPQYVWG